MKYIVLEVTDHARSCTEKDLVREFPIIFPEALVHSDVAHWISRILRYENRDAGFRDVRPVSAGFIHSMTFAAGAKTGYFCHGKSESLGVNSRPEHDSKLLVNYDYSRGVVS